MTTNDQADRARQIRRRGQLLALLGIILTSLNLRAGVTSLSDIFSFAAEAIPGFSITVMGTLPLLCFAVFGAIAPILQRRIGFEEALFISMILIGAGLFARSFADGFGVFVFSSVVAFAGMGFGNVLLPPIFKKYFPDNIGAVTALYSVIITISSGLPSAISADTVSVLGWRTDIFIWSIVGFVAAIPWLLEMLHLRGLRTSGGTQDKTPERRIAVYKWGQAWAIAILFGVGGMLPMYTLITWMPVYFESRGIGNIGNILFAYNLAGIAHSLIIPMVLGRMKRPFLLILLAMLCQLVSCLGLLLHVELVWLWMIIAAPGLLTVPASFQLFNLRTRTPAGTVQLSSFVMFAGYIFAALGPWAFGKLLALSGDYLLPFSFLIAATSVMTIAGYFAVRDRYLEDMTDTSANRAD